MPVSSPLASGKNRKQFAPVHSEWSVCSSATVKSRNIVIVFIFFFTHARPMFSALHYSLPNQMYVRTNCSACEMVRERLHYWETHIHTNTHSRSSVNVSSNFSIYLFTFSADYSAHAINLHISSANRARISFSEMKINRCLSPCKIEIKSVVIVRYEVKHIQRGCGVMKYG